MFKRPSAAPSPILNVQFPAAAAADPTHRRRRDQEHEGVLDGEQFGLQFTQHLACRGAALGALSDRLHGHENGTGIRRVGKRGAVKAGKANGIGNFRVAANDGRSTLNDRVRSSQTRARRQLHNSDQIALVLIGGLNGDFLCDAA